MGMGWCKCGWGVIGGLRLSDRRCVSLERKEFEG